MRETVDFYNRLVLAQLIERNKKNFILVKANFAGIVYTTANKFNAGQDEI